MGLGGSKSKSPKPVAKSADADDAEAGSGAWATKTTWADAAKPDPLQHGVPDAASPVTSPGAGRREDDEADEECEVIDVGKPVGPSQQDPARGHDRGPGPPEPEPQPQVTAPPHVYSQANVQEAPVDDGPGELVMPQAALPAEQQKAADRLAKQRAALDAKKGLAKDPFDPPAGTLHMPTFGGLEDLEEAILRDGLSGGLSGAPHAASSAKPAGQEKAKFDESDEDLMDTILNEIDAVT